MKLILAIINHDDTTKVVRALTKEHFQVTKLATTGGFLSSGNTTIIIGTEAEYCDKAISVIRANASSRDQAMPTGGDMGSMMYSSMPMQVTVGGATVFIMDVERFEKL